MKKRKDGRYSKTIHLGYSPDGKRLTKSVYGLTIKEVERKEREIRQQLDAGIKIGVQTTVGEWAEYWLQHFKTSLAHNTYNRYDAVIQKQLKPYVGNYRLNQVTTAHLQNMVNELNKSLKPASVKKVKDVMLQMFQQAVRARYIVFNPADGLEIPRLPKGTGKAIPKAHVKRIKEFCAIYPRGDFFMFLLHTGMRRGEILALTVGDIDLVEKEIHVTKAVEYLGDKPRIKVPKTPKSVRDIPILDDLIPYLERAMSGRKSHDVLFPNTSGEIYTRSQIQMLMRDFQKAYNRYIGCEDSAAHFSLHQFRHTFCTTLYEAGIDVKQAQYYMGHNSVSVTMDIYTHLSEEKKHEGREKLNSYLRFGA